MEVEASDRLFSYLGQKGIFPDRSEKQIRLYFSSMNTTVCHTVGCGGGKLKEPWRIQHLKYIATNKHTLKHVYFVSQHF